MEEWAENDEIDCHHERFKGLARVLNLVNRYLKTCASAGLALAARFNGSRLLVWPLPTYSC